MQPAANPTPAYSTRQIMLSLAYVAYCGDQITDSNPEQQILSLVTRALAHIPPVEQWQVVWGPVAYTTPGSRYQDNLMYVARNTANTERPEFAVAIRGTNFVSDLDWLMEDLDVLATMPWPPAGPVPPAAAHAEISEATSIGLQVLLAMRSNLPAGTGPAQSLLEFLRAATSPRTPIYLYVTGHSLGGCLAGTLGLYLKENAATWDATTGQSLVSCVTFAAPTAGNQQFASYSDASFRVQNNQYPPNWDTALGSTFDAVCCTLDVAPLAWVANNVSSGSGPSPIFDMYDNGEGSSWFGNNDTGVDFSEMATPYYIAWNEVVLPYLLPDVATALRAVNYTQVTPGPALTGSVNADYVVYNQDFETTFNCFVAQATYQHSDSYPNLLNVPQLLDKTIIVEHPTPKSAPTPPSVRPATVRRQALVRGLDQLMKRYAALPAAPSLTPAKKTARPAPAAKATKAAKPATTEAAKPAKATNATRPAAAKAAKPAAAKAAKPAKAAKAARPAAAARPQAGAGKSAPGPAAAAKPKAVRGSRKSGPS